jgi:hypothetical protein
MLEQLLPRRVKGSCRRAVRCVCVCVCWHGGVHEIGFLESWQLELVRRDVIHVELVLRKWCPIKQKWSRLVASISKLHPTAQVVTTFLLLLGRYVCLTCLFIRLENDGAES